MAAISNSGQVLHTSAAQLQKIPVTCCLRSVVPFYSCDAPKLSPDGPLQFWHVYPRNRASVRQIFSGDIISSGLYSGIRSTYRLWVRKEEK